MGKTITVIVGENFCDLKKSIRMMLLFQTVPILITKAPFNNGKKIYLGLYDKGKKQELNLKFFKR